jgi:iron-sulfur cluster repair protein YtfE (RIC family)
VTQTEHDVVQLLTNQHEEIRRLFDLVENSPGEAREQAFDSLRAYLAVHETAEEEVVHPYSRQTMESSGARTIDPILEEEKEAKKTLKHLERVGTKSPEFLPLFRDFRKAVEAHAEHEEQNEFPRLRANGKPEELRGMADLVRAAEAVAPTRPHPGTESAVKNLLVGPFASMSDRVRDAIKSAKR